MMPNVGKLSRDASERAQAARRAELDALRQQRPLRPAEQQEYDRLHQRLYFRVYRAQRKARGFPTNKITLRGLAVAR